VRVGQFAQGRRAERDPDRRCLINRKLISAKKKAPNGSRDGDDRATGSLPAKSDAEARRGGFESLIFNSRWLMAPFYLGLVISLAVLLLKFGMMLWEFIVHAPGSKESDIILACSA